MPKRSKNRHQSRRVVAAVMNEPWALLPRYVEVMAEIVELRSEGLTFTSDEIRARVGREEEQEEKRTWQLVDGVAVLPLYGMLAPRMNMFMAISGGTSTQQFAGWFAEALNHSRVKAVVLDVDSPGGSVQGNRELADVIFQGRGTKPIVAVATNMMCSAAYYVASAADRIVASPSALVGSLGTYMIHRESSRAMENAGIKYSVIKAGENKAAGLDVEPLTAQSRALLQERVDSMNALFMETVARNRGVSVATVNERYGQGKDVIAREGLSMGLVDRVGTLSEVLGELRSKASRAKAG